MTRQRHGRVPVASRPGQHVEALGFAGEVLLLDIVALRLQAVGQPVAHTLLVAGDGLDFDEALVEGKEIVGKMKPPRGAKGTSTSVALALGWYQATCRRSLSQDGRGELNELHVLLRRYGRSKEFVDTQQSSSARGIMGLLHCFLLVEKEALRRRWVRSFLLPLSRRLEVRKKIHKDPVTPFSDDYILTSVRSSV